jgi:hypothetical protein
MELMNAVAISGDRLFPFAKVVAFESALRVLITSLLCEYTT